MHLFKNEVKTLTNQLGIRHQNLIGMLDRPGNEKTIIKGQGKFTKQFKPDSVLFVNKVEFNLVIDDYITVLKNLKGLKT